MTPAFLVRIISYRVLQYGSSGLLQRALWRGQHGLPPCERGVRLSHGDRCRDASPPRRDGERREYGALKPCDGVQLLSSTSEFLRLRA
jgi:hypothetical protein